MYTSTAKLLRMIAKRRRVKNDNAGLTRNTNKSRSRGKEENDDDSNPELQEQSRKKSSELNTGAAISTLREHFTVHGNCIALNGDNKRRFEYKIPMPDIKDPMDFNTAYGNIGANSHDGVHKYRWTFRIIPRSKGSGNGSISIGIDSSKKEYSSTNFCGNHYRRKLKQDYSVNSNGTFYGLTSRSTMNRRDSRIVPQSVAMSHRVRDGEYGEIFHTEQSEVVMELNVKEKTLRYYVDRRAFGIAFQDILFRDTRLQYIEYTMAVSVGMMDAEIELVDFKKVMMKKVDLSPRRYGLYERRMKRMRQKKAMKESRKRTFAEMMTS